MVLFHLFVAAVFAAERFTFVAPANPRAADDETIVTEAEIKNGRVVFDPLVSMNSRKGTLTTFNCEREWNLLVPEIESVRALLKTRHPKAAITLERLVVVPMRTDTYLASDQVSYSFSLFGVVSAQADFGIIEDGNKSVLRDVPLFYNYNDMTQLLVRDAQLYVGEKGEFLQGNFRVPPFTRISGAGFSVMMAQIASLFGLMIYVSLSPQWHAAFVKTSGMVGETLVHAILSTFIFPMISWESLRLHWLHQLSEEPKLLTSYSSPSIKVQHPLLKVLAKKFSSLRANASHKLPIIVVETKENSFVMMPPRTLVETGTEAEALEVVMHPELFFDLYHLESSFFTLAGPFSHFPLHQKAWEATNGQDYKEALPALLKEGSARRTLLALFWKRFPKYQDSEALWHVLEATKDKKPVYSPKARFFAALSLSHELAAQEKPKEETIEPEPTLSVNVVAQLASAPELWLQKRAVAFLPRLAKDIAPEFQALLLKALLSSKYLEVQWAAAQFLLTHPEFLKLDLLLELNNSRFIKVKRRLRSELKNGALNFKVRAFAEASLTPLQLIALLPYLSSLRPNTIREADRALVTEALSSTDFEVRVAAASQVFYHRYSRETFGDLIVDQSRELLGTLNEVVRTSKHFVNETLVGCAQWLATFRLWQLHIPREE